MNVALPKPGFGKLPDRPSFDKKTLAAKAKSGTTGTATYSPLGTSVAKNISTATLSNECRTRAATRNTSTPFVAATSNMSVHDYKRDRTVSVPHGAIQGKHGFASATGMTGRSFDRTVDRYIKQQEEQRMAYLNQMNSMYGNNNCVHQNNMSFSDMMMTTFSLIKDSGLFNFGGEKGAKTKASQPISDNTSIAAMQNAATSADLSSAIDSAVNKTMENSGKITKAKEQISGLKSKTSGLKSASDGAAKAVSDNKTAIQNKTSEVQNNINRESASQMAMNVAQSQVDSLTSQLNSLPADSIARKGVETALNNAKEQLELKKQQYEQAVADREKSQQELQSLKGQTQGLENKAATAKADYENNVSTISSLESEMISLEKQNQQINDAVEQQKTRLEEMKQKEEKDKK